MVGELRLISTSRGMGRRRWAVSMMSMHSVSSSVVPVMETMTGLRADSWASVRLETINSMFLSVSKRETGLYPRVFRLARPEAELRDPDGGFWLFSSGFGLREAPSKNAN